jgi:peptidyl-prolyl cis-trans isomerase SurA
MTAMLRALPIVLAAVLSAMPLRAEIVDEIVAKVNDDIVTKSDLDAEEQAALEDVYKRASGTELDRQIKHVKDELLRNVVDRKVLLQRAPHLFDTTKMQDFFLQSFKDQQNIKSDKELERMLAQEGMTINDWKKKLVEFLAPEQVLRSEVVERVAVSEKDARADYDAHVADYTVPAEATVREIVVKGGGDPEAARARAEALRARAAADGADFEAIAREASESSSKSSGGLLGTVKKGDLAAPLEEAAFTQPVGSVGPVIEVGGVFHILKVDARTDAYVKSFASVQDDIEKRLREDQIRKDTRAYLKKLWAETTIWISPKYQARLSPEPAGP